MTARFSFTNPLRNTIRWAIFTSAKELTNSQLNLPHGTKQKSVVKELKTKNPGCSEETVQSWTPCVSPEAGKICERGRSWAAVREWGSYRWWVDRVRRCGRSMNRQDRDRGSGMRLTERTKKLIPETKWINAGRSDQLHIMRMMLVVERG